MDGVLVVGYGAPESLDEIPSFMTSLIGRTPSPAMLERMTEHYELIGGKSPLVGYAREIARKIERHYDENEISLPVEIGMIHTPPSVDEAVDALVDCGVTRIIAISLSPFYSTASNGKSFARVAQSAQRYENLEVVCAPEIGLYAGFIEAHAQILEELFEKVDVEADIAPLSFSAHSLPIPDVEAGDYVYEEGLRKAADALAERLFLAPADEEGFMIGEQRAYGTEKLPRPWAVTFQSQGMRGDKWLEPTLNSFIDEVQSRDYKAMVSVPLGFSTDHMETLYDLRIAAKKKAEEQGIVFFVSSAPNDSDALIEAFVESIEDVRL